MNNPFPKTLLITVSEASVATSLLRGSFLEKMKERGSIHVVLVVHETKHEEYLREFGAPHVSVEPFGPLRFSFLERVNIFFARNVVKTDMVTFVQMRQYLDFGNVPALIVKRILWHLCGRSKLFQSFVRFFEVRLPSAERARELFDLYHPDVVFATVADYTEIDIPILREARKRDIKTVGMLRGWDAFVSHGILRVIPDTLLLQNAYLAETGRKFQFIPQERMTVVGFPSYDFHFDPTLIEPREVFCKRMGIDPAKKIILFGAMEFFWFPKDGDIAEVFDELVHAGELPSNVVMLFRPYPGFTGPLERASRLSTVVPDVVSFSENHGDFVEMRRAQLHHLLNSIVHSSIVMSVASTIAIDGVALKKPTIAPLFEKEPADYWFSAARFKTHCTHFRDVYDTGGVRVVENPKDFARAIKEYLGNPQSDEKGRERLRSLFIEPYDGKAGERIAEEVFRVIDG